MGRARAQPGLSPNDLSKVLTEEQIAFLTERTGMSRDELLAGLSERLPQVVDELTPEGRVPTTEEMARRVGSPLRLAGESGGYAFVVIAWPRARE